MSQLHAGVSRVLLAQNLEIHLWIYKGVPSHAKKETTGGMPLKDVTGKTPEGVLGAAMVDSVPAGQKLNNEAWLLCPTFAINPSVC